MRVELLKANCCKGVSKVWVGMDTVFFYWGVDDREKKGVSMFLALE